MEENGQHKKTRKKEKRLSFWYILGGGVLKEDFILRHTRMIVLLVVLAFFFIGNRYTCMQKLREIDRLQQQLRDVRFEALSISSELTGNSRQSRNKVLIWRVRKPLLMSYISEIRCKWVCLKKTNRKK